jgi:hypothetical protein
MESKENEILSAIKNKMQSLGFEEMETNSPDFSVAYVQKSFIDSRIAFLITNYENIRDYQLPEVKTKARAWCIGHLDANLVKKECGLNIIFLHQGELTEDTFKGLIDKTGLNVPILQSITGINVQNLSIFQCKTWIVIGNVKKALKELKHISVN